MITGDISKVKVGMSIKMVKGPKFSHNGEYLGCHGIVREIKTNRYNVITLHIKSGYFSGDTTDFYIQDNGFWVELEQDWDE